MLPVCAYSCRYLFASANAKTQPARSVSSYNVSKTAENSVFTLLRGTEMRAMASEDGVSGGQARKAQFVEYRQNGNDLCPRAEG